MKKILLIGTILISIFSCNQGGNNSSDVKSDSLSSIIAERDSSLSDFIFSFYVIESNLDSVAAKQRIISLYNDGTRAEFKGSKEAHINAEIAAINELMETNREEIETLTKKLKTSKSKNLLLEKTIKTLTIQISQKDYELCELNLELVSLNKKVSRLVTAVDSLSEQNYIKSVVIDYQALDLQAVYYIVAEEKELKEEKIIDQKGGLLGIGKTTTLNNDFDNTRFKQVDLTEVTKIPVDSKDIKIVTTHPSDSYKLDMDNSKKDLIKNLIITNPIKFWSTSKYLVIVKK